MKSNVSCDYELLMSPIIEKNIDDNVPVYPLVLCLL